MIRVLTVLCFLLSVASSSRNLDDDQPKAERYTDMYCEEENELLSVLNRRFTCPQKFDPPENKFCCGTKNNRYCCDNVFGLNEDDVDWVVEHVGAFIGIVLGVIFLILICICACCCCLPCCLLSKRRQRNRQGAPATSMTVVTQPVAAPQPQYYPPPQQTGYAPVPQQGYPPQPGYPQPGYPQPGYPPQQQPYPPPYTPQATDAYQPPMAKMEAQKQPAFNPNYST